MTEKASTKSRKAILNVNPPETSPAAELISNNIDILTEILTRFPVKSIIRFKCVSKHWFSLLSDPQFAKNYSTRNPTPSISGLFFYIEKTLNSVSLHGRRQNLPSLSFLYGLGKPSRFRVVHSSNGLLLCSNNTKLDYYGYARRWQYIVCNPTTKKYTVIDRPVGSIPGCSAYLAFDPSKSPHHYKVVLASYNFNQIDVYSSLSLCWTTVFPEQKYYGHCRIWYSAFWNGAIHWLLTIDNVLNRFDVNSEEIIAMPNLQSPQIMHLHNILYFGECSGGLILIQSRLICPRGFRILELEKDYSCWVFKCQVNLRPLISEFPEIEKRENIHSGGFKVLFAMMGDCKRDFALVLAISGSGRTVSYNLKYKTWDVLDLASGGLLEFDSYNYEASHVVENEAFSFVETLYPV